MSPLRALHVTSVRHRDGIRTYGLLPNQPARGRPFGVYVFGDEFHHPAFSRGGLVVWSHHRAQDTYQVSYIGPLVADQYVINGLVLLREVEPEHVTLVTGNK